MQKPILVFKIGTSSITDSNGNLDEMVVQSVAKQLASLHKEYHIVVVSSGAVGTGKKFIKNYAGKIEERKAAAAIGNPILIYKYSEAFAKYKIPIAQSLCERGHFSDREKFLQLRATYEELWKNGIIPIANENDVVSSRELKFSDNDELATLLAVGFGAQLLLIGTSVDGVLDANGKVVRTIDKFDDKILSMATKEKSAAGLGGMISKLTFAHMATNLGIRVIIFPAREKNGLLNAVKEKVGTVCIPKSVSKNARQKWLASGSLVIGSIVVDDGAQKALLKRKSLLAVGVKNIQAAFEEGEAIEMLDTAGNAFAVARAKISSKQLQKNLKQQNLVLAHADDIVLM
ncbi:MAG TPA: glutamate 5-kinase [Chitinophagales bacterium]|nr:glutamate 5-kinase [Chitinophagales bacterium]